MPSRNLPLKQCAKALFAQKPWYTRLKLWAFEKLTQFGFIKPALTVRSWTGLSPEYFKTLVGIRDQQDHTWQDKPLVVRNLHRWVGKNIPPLEVTDPQILRKLSQVVAHHSRKRRITREVVT